MEVNRAVFAGSFDPITLGHIDIIVRASKDFDMLYVLLAINKDKQYSFDVDTRINMVKESVSHLKNVEVHFTEGLTVDFASEHSAHTLIRGIRNADDLEYENNMKELNHKLNPNINTVYYQASDKYKDVSSSDIKRKIANNEDVSKLLPEAVIKKLHR